MCDDFNSITDSRCLMLITSCELSMKPVSFLQLIKEYEITKTETSSEKPFVQM